MTNQPVTPEPWDGSPTGFVSPGHVPEAQSTAPLGPPYAQPQSYAYPYAPYGYYVSPPTNTLAIVSFIIGFFIPPAGFILAIIALRQIGRSGEGGRGLAIAGLAVSAVLVFLFVLYVILLISLVAFIGG